MYNIIERLRGHPPLVPPNLSFIVIFWISLRASEKTRGPRPRHATMDVDDVVDTVSARTWKPGSWRNYEALQMATYDDKALYDITMAKLSSLPPLVTAYEVDNLTSLLAQCARGDKFIIQGGDCAERFVDCNADYTTAQIKLVVQMGAVFETATGVPPVRVCRIAGQYGKPRSSPVEKHPTLGEIKSFKGENINGFEPTERAWDPRRLLEGYWHSAACQNFMRGLQMDPEFASKMLSGLDAAAYKASPKYASYAKTVSEIQSAPPNVAGPMFTAHEAMQLDLEEALTREVPGKGFYNLSAHMVWIGDRTRQLTGGHVEYFRGIKNPIGCKVGPSMAPDELQRLVKILNPDKVEGRLVLITRYGNDKVEAMLPAHIRAVQASGVPVVWQVDGVHGNTVTAANKLKTRKFDDVLGECTKALAIHRELGSVLAGMHLEMTGQPHVTECTGGSINVLEEMLGNHYETLCDPRFNYSQGLEAAFVMSHAFRGADVA